MSDSDLVSRGSQVLACAREHPEMFSTPDSQELLLELELDIQGFRAQQAYEVYQTRGDLNALEVCIQNWRHIMDMTEDDRPEKAATLMNLGVSLNARYKATGELRDLEESISLFQLADALTPDDSPDKYMRLLNLAVSLFSLFQREGRSEDLEEAIDLCTRAIELVPNNHADKPGLLNNLGTSLLTQFGHSGTPNDLDKAISLQSHAVDLTPDGNLYKPMWLMNLGNSLETRYEQLGNLEDVERAIKLHSQAVELTPDGHPSKAMRLSNTGNSLVARYDRLGNLDDLSRAIEFQSRAVDMSPDSHPSKPARLNNLANSLQTQYQRTGDARDLEQAIKHQTCVVILTPDGHPDKAMRLNNLGTKLKTRFERSGSREDLNAAIAHQRNAVALTPDGHPNKQSWLHNLSKSLQAQFDRVGDATDLEEAIRCSAQSVALLPENHPDRAQNLRLLGLLFLTRLRSPHAHTDDATHAMEAFFTAMQHPTSHPLERLKASGLYALLLTQFPDHLPPSPPLSPLEAYQHALDLIPQCIWLGNNVRGRYTSEELETVTEVVSNAVAAAITAGEYGRVLEWVETGRAVVWSQVLQLRTPVDDLQQLHPQLAEDFLRVSQALQHIASSTEPTPNKAQSTKSPLNSGAQSPHGYALEYNKLITKIRELEDFQDFMQPKKLLQFAKACDSGPVVVISVHQSRCDALVLHRSGNVAHVPLPDFSFVHARGAQQLLWRYLHSTCLLRRWRSDLRDDPGSNERGARVFPVELEPLDLMRGLLGILWLEVVKPIMDVVMTLPSVPQNGTLPHVTWCPTGPLAFLPLHAAGIYSQDGDDRTPLQTIMDIAVSSYTPTLEALLKPRMKIGTDAECPKTLVVSQPNTPGCNPISGTTKEAGIVMSLLDMTATKPLHDTEGTVDAVLEDMATHPWVHLACHGIQDSDDPLNSAFCLYDGRLTLDMLMTKHLPNADLAVLSACQTATGNEKLPDEAVHLAAGMLNIGYKSVVGTMWSICDSSAPIVMGEFYRVLAAQVKAGGEIQSAYALHEATKLLREKNGVSDFKRWIPFVHFGL